MKIPAIPAAQQVLRSAAFHGRAARHSSLANSVPGEELVPYAPHYNSPRAQTMRPHQYRGDHGQAVGIACMLSLGNKAQAAPWADDP